MSAPWGRISPPDNRCWRRARNSGRKNNSVRHDLIDRYKDVDLESGSKLGYDEDGLPAITGRDRFYGDYKEQDWKDKYSGEKKRKKKKKEEEEKD